MQPVSSGERLLQLDVVRSVALLGILLVNFQFFTSPLQSVLLGDAPEAGLDRLVAWLLTALAENKFYPLFSMLFGAGLALMSERAAAAGGNSTAAQARRLTVLAVVGAAHLVLIWSGDILLMYAILGFIVLVAFRRTPPGRLPKWGAFFVAVPALMAGVASLLLALDAEFRDGLAEAAAAGRQQVLEAAAQAEAAYAAGGYADALRQRLVDATLLSDKAVYVGPGFLGFFLIGRWLYASGCLHSPDKWPRWLAWPIAIGVGLPLSFLATWLMFGQDPLVLNPSNAAGMCLMVFAAAALALGYLHVVIVHAERLRWLAPAGQMALTNYLLQSLVWTWFFYGHGLGMWGRVTLAQQMILAVAFFAAQVAASHWWLRRFRFGPAEWLWRSLTYMRWQPLRHAPRMSASGTAHPG